MDERLRINVTHVTLMRYRRECVSELKTLGDVAVRDFTV
jgi:hypothetical protein